MKIVCEICKNSGQLQHIGKNYYRVKHYLGSVDGKLRFEYHKQSLEYISNILDIPTEGKLIDPIDQKTIDPKLKDFSLYECEGWDSNPISSGDVSRKSLLFLFFRTAAILSVAVHWFSCLFYFWHNAVLKLEF